MKKKRNSNRFLGAQRGGLFKQLLACPQLATQLVVDCSRFVSG